MTLRLTLLSLIALALPACGDGNKITETGDDSGTAGNNTDAGTDSTIGMSSSPTTGEVPVTTTDGSDSQTGDVPQTASSSVSATEDSAGSATTDGPVETTNATSEGDSTGEVDPQIVEHCNSVCGKFVECDAMPDQDACAAACIDNLGGEAPACEEANVALLTCIEGMTCDEVKAFLEDETPGPCADQLAAVETECGGNDCIGSVGTNEDGTECSISTECPDEPAQTLSCDQKTCTCTIGDMKTAECPAMNVCAAIEDLEAKAKDCCGF